MKTKPAVMIVPNVGASEDVDALMRHVQPGGASDRASVMPLVQSMYDTWRDGVTGVAPDRPTSGIDRLHYDLGQALFTALSAPPVFDHAEDWQALREVYYAIEARMLSQDCGSDQAGLGSVLSGLRHAAIEAEAGPDGVMPREIAFSASGIGYRTINLVAKFPPAGEHAHLGRVQLEFAGVGRRLGELDIADVTGYRQKGHSIEALGTIHRFGRYGTAVSTFGNWFSADGHGREMLAAMVGGLVNRVKPDLANGMGGVSPQFALTQSGVEFVLVHPKLASSFSYASVQESTAFLANGDRRVPFDIHTGAILGQLEPENRRYMAAYVTRSNLAGVERGSTHRREDMGYLLTQGIGARRAQQIHVEDAIATALPLLRYTEEEFDQAFGLVNGSASGTTNYERSEVEDKDPCHVWSLIESDDDETVYAVPGLNHHVNNIGYAVTERAWPHENIEAVYMAAMEERNDMRM